MPQLWDGTRESVFLRKLKTMLIQLAYGNMMNCKESDDEIFMSNVYLFNTFL